MTRAPYFSIQSFDIKRKALTILVFVLGVSIGVTGLSNPASAKGNPRYASIVMDADTGLILSESRANRSLHPASLTKMMTLLMTFEAIEKGELSMKDRVRISRHAANMVPSKLDLPVGSSIRVEDAIYSLVTKSANDVAVALAEHLGQSESNFAKMMTNRAHEIGMTRTVFRNASGLHNPRQISTARDMSKLARVIINRYPSYYRYFSTKNFTYRGKTYRNHNRLMARYDGMDGMKTGYVQASGFNLVSSAVRNNRRLIGVVFGGRTSKSRNAHMAKLMDRGFAKMNDIRVANIKVPLPPRKPGILVALQTLNDMKPASGAEAGDTKWASLNSSLQNGVFSRLIGEGDSDPVASKRIETGLMAIAAHKGEKIPEKYMQIVSIDSDKTALTPFKSDIQKQAHSSAKKKGPTINGPWAIQVGAFASRAKTDRVISNALKNLPSELTEANPMIAPLSTDTGWVFRGRLSGYTRDQALQACSYLQDCLPIAPKKR